MVLDEPDQLTKTRTLYDVSVGEIMWRNFLAGISRALGGMVIYFVVAFLLGHVFLTYIWPVLEPSIETLGETGEILQQMQLLQPTYTR
ncbi:MAG: hypothetical protein QG639_922 [Patescibacteria group bacterium]|jgi:hypothetical protein|nr:hypothetical protein [Patescibacteria group bacterium]